MLKLLFIKHLDTILDIQDIIYYYLSQSIYSDLKSRLEIFLDGELSRGYSCITHRSVKHLYRGLITDYRASCLMCGTYTKYTNFIRIHYDLSGNGQYDRNHCGTLCCYCFTDFINQ